MINTKNTITCRFVNRIEISPNSPAIGWINGDQLESFSFKEYGEIIQAMACSLNQYQVTENCKIAILGDTCKEWHFFDLASLCCRAIVVPIYHTYSPSEIEYILAHSECSYICVQNNDLFKKIIPLLKNLPQIKYVFTFKKLSDVSLKDYDAAATVIDYESLLEIGRESLKNNPAIFQSLIEAGRPQDIASIIYTSGTTGIPKGAVITHEAICTQIDNIQKFTKGIFNERDRALIFLPLSHVFGRIDSFGPLIFGWQSFYAESYDALMKNIKLIKPTIMMAVPKVFERFYEIVLKEIESAGIIKQHLYKWAEQVSNDYFETIEKDRTPSTWQIAQHKLAFKSFYKNIYDNFGGCIRFFISGGAPLAKDVFIFLRNSNLTVLEGYGLTETIAPCCLNPPSRQVPETVGQPIGDVQISFEEDGEILIKSKALFSEYYKDQAATDEAFINGWFKTGDVGQFNPWGYLKITDRKKDIIITSAGKNIAPQKIEGLLKLQNYCAYPIIIGDGRKYITALIGIDKEQFKDIAGIRLEDDMKIFAENAEIKNRVAQSIKAVNLQLSSFEQIKKFRILPVVIGTHNYMTPSQKLKKKVLVQDFKSLIDSMY